MEVQLHSILNSALCGHKSPISRPGRFTTWKETEFPFNVRLGGPQDRIGCFGVQETFLIHSGIRTRDRPARSLAAIETTAWPTKCHTIDCTHNTFLMLQKHLTSGTELILIGWKMFPNESLLIVCLQGAHLLPKCARKRL